MRTSFNFLNCSSLNSCFRFCPAWHFLKNIFTFSSLLSSASEKRTSAPASLVCAPIWSPCHTISGRWHGCAMPLRQLNVRMPACAGAGDFALGGRDVVGLSFWRHRRGKGEGGQQQGWAWQGRGIAPTVPLTAAGHLVAPIYFWWLQCAVSVVFGMVTLPQITCQCCHLKLKLFTNTSVLWFSRKKNLTHFPLSNPILSCLWTFLSSPSVNSQSLQNRDMWNLTA